MRKRSAWCAALALVLLLTGCRGRTSTTASQVHIRDYAGVPAYEQPTATGGEDGTSVTLDPNADVQVDIWMDGTPSMAGFVAGDLATAYRKALPRIEETAYNMWIQADVSYYRFEVSLLPEDFADIEGMDAYLGETGQTLEELTRSLYAFAPISAGDTVRAYEQADFYSKTTYFADYSAGEGDVLQAVTDKVRSIAAVNWDSQTLPPLRTALTMANPDSLNVIVTDLYEEKGMVESIGRLMTDRFFSQGKTVAVLGIQSEFAGPIYDIGESDQTINYGVDENRNFVEYKSHPFYLLLIGDENEVNAFAQALKEKFDAEIADNEFYTCEVQLMKTGNWGEAADAADITGFATDGTLTGQTQKDETSLASGQVADLRYTIPRAEATARGQTPAPAQEPESVYFDFTVPVRVLTDKEVDFSTFTFTAEAQVERTVLQEVASGRRTGSDAGAQTAEETGLPITATVGSSRYAGDFVADETSAALVKGVEVLSVGEAQRDGEALTCPVTFRVTLQTPEDIGIYRILLTASAQCPADLFPTDLEPWVDEWDISVADELTWLSDPASFDGSKTLYLKRIMNQLVVSSNTVQTTGANALSPTHDLVSFYVDLYVDEQGYFRSE
ncbi:MAG: hypothetical protein ACOX83_00490 [Candidatus Spyradocola sp.]